MTRFPPSIAIAGDLMVFGYIDKAGKYVIKPEFHEALPIRKGVAEVHTNYRSLVTGPGEDDESYKMGYIDKRGTWIWTPTE